MSDSRVLFLIKRKEDYNPQTDNHIGLSTGLYNSAEFVREMLDSARISTKLSVVVDNNDIYMAAKTWDATHVIIEALWVVPEKFVELQRLLPNVTWIVRLHSESPFIANEGIAMDWIAEYSGCRNLILACNSHKMTREMQVYLKARNRWTAKQAEEKVVFLPNYYPAQRVSKRYDGLKAHVDVCCFGAIRPMKNQLIQAIAAVEFAEYIGKPLRFHVNAGRVETNGDPVVKNLRTMFEQLYESPHRMIIHTWTPHEQFIDLCRSMDVGLQVSFSETFNIVGADLINNSIPLVSSHELPWTLPHFCANPTDSRDICRKLVGAYRFPRVNTWLNHRGLAKYSKAAKAIWIKYFRGN